MRRLVIALSLAALILAPATVAAKGNPHRTPAAAVVSSPTVSDCVFGGTAHVSAPGAAGLGLIYGIQAESGGQAGEILLDANGEGDINCGPTPTWLSGAGNGQAEVVEHDPTVYSLFVVVSDVVSFTVAAS